MWQMAMGENFTISSRKLNRYDKYITSSTATSRLDSVLGLLSRSSDYSIKLKIFFYNKKSFQISLISLKDQKCRVCPRKLKFLGTLDVPKILIGLSFGHLVNSVEVLFSLSEQSGSSSPFMQILVQHPLVKIQIWKKAISKQQVTFCQ